MNKLLQLFPFETELFEEWKKKVETKSWVCDEQCEFLTSPFNEHEWLLSSNNFDSIHLGSKLNSFSNYSS